MGGVKFWDMSVWFFIIELGVLFGAMLLANFLRRTIGPLRKSLIPSSVVGGFLLLIANFLWQKLTGYAIFEKLTMELFTYHCLGLGFIALSLKSTDRKNSSSSGTDIFNTGVTVVATYLVQALLGLALSFGLSYVIGNWNNAGLLLPMGFGQGPGQAYNWGNVYETATAYPAFENGTSFGLTIAAMGFVAASIGGVIYLQIMKKKGRVNTELFADQTDSVSAIEVCEKGEIPLTEALDKLTVQCGLVFLTYMLTFGLMYIISMGCDALGGFFVGTVKPLVWGFNFLFGSLMAMVVKSVIRFLRMKGVMKREYRNPFMLSRISGTMFDLMVVASIAAINLSAFKHKEFLIPLIILTLAGGLATFFYIRYVSIKIYPAYRDQAFLSLYGMLTGTASTGVILLREIDPNFETPASDNLIYQQLWAILFGFPMLLLLGLSPKSLGSTILTLVLLVVLFAVMNIILFRKSIFKNRGKTEK
ncbi:MAG: hypothetical protein IJE90_01285 [Clostridia bacterium]|nr:hypothetical protein [Clostridia bacterium]